MTWPESRDATFPSRRREPERLRDDIIDELADHLALAAAEERASGAGEEAWNRALERFGDPDVVARQLWWDALKEHIMREWIQTFFIALLVVIMCGFAFLAFDQLRKSNHALLTSMEASNAAMLASLENMTRTNTQIAGMLQQEMEQRVAGLPSSEALASPAGHSMIQIEVRRGTETGLPAAGVEVHFRTTAPEGKGLEVNDHTGPDGKVAFGPVRDGEYVISLIDPFSGMRMKDISVVRFAGRGQENVLVIAPDVSPQRIEMALNLPAVGADEDLFFMTKYETTWGEAPFVWTSAGDALLGKEGTWNITQSGARRDAISVLPRDQLLALRRPLEVAGTILTLSGIELFRVENTGGVATVEPLGRSSLHQVLPLDGGPAELTLSSETVMEYESIAMLQLINKLNLSISGPVFESVRGKFQDSVPTYASVLSNAKTGYWKDAGGAVQFSPFVSSRLMIFEPVENNAGMIALGFPDLSESAYSAQASYYVLIRIKPQSAVTNRIFLDGKSTDYAFAHNLDNTLEAFPILTPWSVGDGEKIIRLGPKPIWSANGAALKSGAGEFLYVDVTEALTNRSESPIHGLALRWKSNANQTSVRGIQLYSSLDEEKNPGFQPQLVVIEPVETVLARLEAQSAAKVSSETPAEAPAAGPDPSLEAEPEAPAQTALEEPVESASEPDAAQE